MRAYLPMIGGVVLILIGGAFLLINMMDQTLWKFLPALAAILVGVGIILWKLPQQAE